MSLTPIPHRIIICPNTVSQSLQTLLTKLLTSPLSYQSHVSRTTLGSSPSNRWPMPVDFNINVDVSNSSLPLSCQLTALSDLFSLEQLVSPPMHTSHTDLTSIIDLVFVPSHVHASSLVVPSVSSSDYNSILTEISPPSPHLSRKCTKQIIWLYHLAGFDKVCPPSFLDSMDQLLSSDRDFSWKVFKDRFSAVVNLCVTSKFISSPTCHPW